MKRLISFFKDEEGATAIEYGLLAALIAVVMAVGATATGLSLDALFDRITLYLDTVQLENRTGAHSCQIGKHAHPLHYTV